MKSVLLSIKPKYCELIADGRKTIEVRKTKPKLDTPFKCYIYCTKGGLNIYGNGKQYVTDSFEFLKGGAGEAFEETSKFRKWNGKVIGEFVCDKMLPIAILAHLMVSTLDCMRACLSAEEIIEYAAGNSYVYGWRISDLKIYDKPRELNKFRQCHKCEHYFYCKAGEYSCDGVYKLTRPPQSWCYVEEGVR